ncbi:MAG: cytochrome c oxidase subunit I [Candidatus Hodarchaeales archaeon]|jgi:cytochrome c oxidase subunit 1
MSEESHSQTVKPFYKSFRTLLGTTNHADIGKLYIAFSLINFVLSGILALIIRIELAFPGPTIVDASTYSILFTAHGTAMIFLVIFPLGVGFGNFLVPPLIGAKDMYWPRWNNAGFWMLLPAALLLYLGETSVGWTLYTPLSLEDFGIGVNTWIVGVLVAGVSSLVSAVNFIMTVVTMRRNGIGWFDLDLFSWSIVCASLIQFLAIPLITTGLLLLLSDRILGTTFFSALGFGAGSFLWQHVFWSYSHPAVYIMILPAMGLTSLLVAKFSRNQIFGYKSMIASMLTITILGFLVWGHHQYTLYGASADAITTIFFNMLTFLIAIPSGIKTFNWLLTMWGGKIKFEVPLVFPMGFVIGFVIGGLTGVWLNIIPIDIVVHDTAFVVGHFHIIIIGGAVTSVLGAFYNFFPDLTGKMYHRRLAWVHCFTWLIGVLVTFNAMMIVGLLGMPRRYFDYSTFLNVDMFAFWHMLATIGAFIMAFSVAVFLINIFYSLFIQKETASDDPFGLSKVAADS